MSKMCDYISSLINDNDTFDTELNFYYYESEENFKKYGHAAILSRARYFRTILTGNWYIENGIKKRRLNLRLESYISEKYIKEFIELIYNIIPKDLESDCLYLYKICDYFGFDDGCEICKSVIEKNINRENVGAIMSLATQLQTTELFIECLQYCKAFLFGITPIDLNSCFNMPLNVLIKLLNKSDTIITSQNKTILNQKIIENLSDTLEIGMFKIENENYLNGLITKKSVSFCMDKSLLQEINQTFKEIKIVCCNLIKAIFTIYHYPGFYHKIEIIVDKIECNINLPIWFDIYILTKQVTIHESDIIYLNRKDFYRKSIELNDIQDNLLFDGEHHQLPIILELRSISNLKTK